MIEERRLPQVELVLLTELIELHPTRVAVTELPRLVNQAWERTRYSNEEVDRAASKLIRVGLLDRNDADELAPTDPLLYIAPHFVI